MKLLRIGQKILLSLIGLVSIFMTGSIIFNLFGIRELEGNYVPFIVYTNLVCGFIYLYAASNKDQNKAFKALLTALLILIIASVSASIYIKNGGIYEDQMPKAMTFRTLFTAIMAGISYYLLKKDQ